MNDGDGVSRNERQSQRQGLTSVFGTRHPPLTPLRNSQSGKPYICSIPASAFSGGPSQHPL
jgi:hypothetical protein